MTDQPIATPPQPKPNLEAYKALLEVDAQERTIKIRQGYYKAYTLSFLFPPIGVYYLIKYLFFANATEDDIKAGLLSFALTVISILLSVGLVAFITQKSTSLIPKQNSEFLKELITPENQKSLKDLYE